MRKRDLILTTSKIANYYCEDNNKINSITIPFMEGIISPDNIDSIDIDYENCIIKITFNKLLLNFDFSSVLQYDGESSITYKNMFCSMYDFKDYENQTNITIESYLKDDYEDRNSGDIFKRHTLHCTRVNFINQTNVMFIEFDRMDFECLDRVKTI